MQKSKESVIKLEKTIKSKKKLYPIELGNFRRGKVTKYFINDENLPRRKYCPAKVFSK